MVVGGVEKGGRLGSLSLWGRRREMGREFGGVEKADGSDQKSLASGRSPGRDRT